MIKKTLATLMFVSAMSFSVASYADAKLEPQMKTLAKNFKAFNNAQNQDSAIQALDNMKAAALEAQKIKLTAKGDTAESSTAVYDQLIAEIDKTKALVTEGHLDHAKIEAKKIAAIRDQGHKLYR